MTSKTDDARVTLASLRARQQQLQTELAAVTAEMDQLMAAMHGAYPVVAIAEFAGLSRQEVHRRIARVT